VQAWASRLRGIVLASYGGPESILEISGPLCLPVAGGPMCWTFQKLPPTLVASQGGECQLNTSVCGPYDLLSVSGNISELVAAAPTRDNTLLRKRGHA